MLTLGCFKSSGLQGFRSGGAGAASNFYMAAEPHKNDAAPHTFLEQLKNVLTFFSEARIIQ
jgi:hypothetical protein